MKKIVALAVIASSFSIWGAGTPARAQWPYGGYSPLPHGGYVYQAPSGWAVPPYYGYGTYAYGYRPYYGWSLPPHGFGSPYYGYGTYGYGYRPYYGWSLPPYGFGSPYYNGYNDPNYYNYGPGIRQFLRMGGADFYGW